MFSCLILCCFFFSRAFHESTMTKPPSCFDWDNIGQRWKMWFRSSYFPYVFNRYFHHFVLKSWVSIFIRQPLLRFSNSNHIKSYTSFEAVFDWTPCHPPKSIFFSKVCFFAEETTLSPSTTCWNYIIYILLCCPPLFLGFPSETNIWWSGEQSISSISTSQDDE